MTLIGYWPLNETSGGTAYDYSGNENHGSLEGSPTQGVNGIVGSNAYNFDGSSDYINLANTTFGDLGFGNPVNTPMTFSIWFYRETDERRTFMATLDTAGSSEQWVTWRTGHDDRGPGFRIRDDNSDTHVEVYTDREYLNQWHHFVGVWDGKGNGEDSLKIYIDGSRDTNTWTRNEDTSANSFVSWDQQIHIGARNSRGSPSQYYPGKLSEARLYNRALSPGEVQYLYNVSRRGRFSSRKKSP